ncbi:sulfite exporter TauE/SafE family protein [Parvularcula marina]|uniref:Probable membrane transporter protein n=1 Tax=Parvularcula marina TaxID=2292771 RepID=A0A371RIT1_9PROT|nr:sulfite exporter TauE/SafE family protein [Parvularcula marina]RFB05356.1 sulfite exporter TauE/SafE family protein [Parvularcula marina]
MNFPDLAPNLGTFAEITVIVVSFLAAGVTATFSIGGGLLLIGVMGVLAPVTAVVPVHGAIMMGGNAGRAFVFRRGLDLPIFGAVFAGALLGALIGGQIVTTLPAAALRLLIAGFILFSQWGPKLRLPFGRKSFFLAGTVSTILNLFVGASGPFITALLAAVPRYDRINLQATAAACMTVQHGLKIVVFGLAGFAFAPWLPLILLSIAAGFAGTLLGAKLLSRFDENQFRSALKWILTALAIYMILLVILKLF